MQLGKSNFQSTYHTHKNLAIESYHGFKKTFKLKILSNKNNNLFPEEKYSAVP